MSGVISEAPLGTVEPSAQETAVARVWCVVPWHARAAEVETLLRDLRSLKLADGPLSASLRVLVVDNASQEQVDFAGAGDLHVDRIRLEENRGGSGGFNAGIERALSECADDEDAFVWLLDSDARPSPTALMELIGALRDRPRLAAAGSALADPESGRVYEIGGIVDRRTGALRPAGAGSAGGATIVPCDYAASCSVLVRVPAIRRAGLMPDLFLHGDDAAWMIGMRRQGGGVAGVPSSVVYHPRFDRFALRGRYYAARNGFAPMRILGLDAGAALRRAMREVGRAVQQALLGRHDLARLHVLGLRDAADGAAGAGEGLSAKVESFSPLSELGGALKPLLADAGSWKAVVDSERSLGLTDAEYQQLCAELGRAGVHAAHPGQKGRCWRVASARLKGAGLLRAAGLILVAPGVRGGGREPGFVVRTGDPITIAWKTLVTGAAALRQAVRVARNWRHGAAPAFPAAHAPRAASTRRMTLSIVVVSYKRWDALRATLARLTALAELAGAQIIVVDNASDDGSAEKVEREFPGVQLIRLHENVGVAAFNRGADAATGDAVLILDDDSWPDVGAVAEAMRTLGADPSVGAVVLHPRHPSSGRSEWRYAAFGEGGRDDWPAMGCGNLVRTDAWRDVGGYEEGFFLYRNDVDLALKLLASGRGVHFNPAWTVWHDSPAAARKSARWHRTATRNWIWLAKRHGRGAGIGGALGAAIGWLWAHRLAGISIRRHWATLRGAVEGAAAPAPRAPASEARARGHFGRLVRFSMGRSDR